jgi:hypothetical protein
VGSRLDTQKQKKEIERAYIAGFLDGDGSLMLQIKKRTDSTRGMRFMATICFYQDARHNAPLKWIQEFFKVGYISHRNDGMTELRINGYKQVRDILITLSPYIRFKKIQAQTLIAACELLSTTTFKKLSSEHLRTLVDHIFVIQNENYVTKKKKTKEELLQLFNLSM